MLLSFEAKNYKSFLEGFRFSMIPIPRLKAIKYSILKDQIASKEYNALCSAVIYGPNASGKTNIINAMRDFKNIVLSGNIEDDPKGANKFNASSHLLGLIPNCFDTQNRPVEFLISFTENGLIFDYYLSIDLGNFMERKHKRKILYEELKVNKKEIFSRAETVNLYKLDMIKKYLSTEDVKKQDLMILSNNSLDPKELFLTNGFNFILAKKLVDIITDWFKNKLNIICQANFVRCMPRPQKTENKGIFPMGNVMKESIKRFGVTSYDLGYAYNEDEDAYQVYSLVNKDSLAVPSEIFESYGTMRFVELFPVIMNALKLGGTLVLDEFDASIHPTVIMNIIKVFHNDEINRNKAQLIFNTHNPIFLNKDLFRRDEIKFVDKKDDGISTHYSLSDFKTYGDSRARNTSDYMKNYFISRYGAIKDVDISDLIMKSVSESGDDAIVNKGDT